MKEYDWNNKLEYLRNTRDLYYNDDYLCFLVNSVWKISKPVHIIDYGCGYGYLGLKLLPLLPIGSKYTGIDKGEHLINEAKKLFQELPYESGFIEADASEIKLESKYDVAVCHAFLLHMNDPKTMLQKMIDLVVDGGNIICFEPHWISNMSSYNLNQLDQSEMIQIGVLQKLFENDEKRNGKDGNIGIKLPVYLSDLGVENIECRVSDKVNFLNANVNQADKKQLYHSLREEGVGNIPAEKEEFIKRLINRGLTFNEAMTQYEAELRFSKKFNMDSSLVYAPSMKITFGVVKKR
ncbi:methyltransferase [Bacillus pseudomycoides]|uniref:Methyltransferase n=1 Tax=Bacillus pseudomycoides TaxID=64104 RepID=A0AA91ZRC5_9BACI|nr:MULTISPECIES: class I SAM-dependent methyltransferase [Bacillus]PEB56097.1 methyltransferase [Bacillus sp. AFS098217]PED80307.1 methyltransferase [Bacillus pseudomycoides]PEU10155.1 methyltransferase [Bacillus sp. AFS014408]PEU18030.1 methyltransferase [Bacillus sp. AFS019443]PFW61203.1 methyltransferase [Bacillus sp. AFS075034]